MSDLFAGLGSPLAGVLALRPGMADVPRKQAPYGGGSIGFCRLIESPTGTDSDPRSVYYWGGRDGYYWDTRWTP